MANTFLFSHILMLFHSPKGLLNKSAIYEKLGKYWSYCTRNCAKRNAYLLDWLIKLKRSVINLLLQFVCFQKILYVSDMEYFMYSSIFR